MAQSKTVAASAAEPFRGAPLAGCTATARSRCADIKKGTRIAEYLGDRISHAEADERYEDHDENDNHTFLFIVDKRTVIDAGVDGNDARFINHACDPNCESEIENGRVFIDAIRDIEPGEELGYDYQIGREKDDPPNVDEIYACRCGSPKCRGTMLWPREAAEPEEAQRSAKASAAHARRRSGRECEPQEADERRARRMRDCRLAVVGAVGIVYGDIGTSPLYAFEKARARRRARTSTRAVLGILSLIFWSLAISVTLKYIVVMMRADNEGEGGILALLALAQDRLADRGPRRAVARSAARLRARRCSSATA